MEEFTNLIAQVQHNPTWNVYLCWIISCFCIYQHFVWSIRGVESLDEVTKNWMEEYEFLVNGEFTLWWKSMPILYPVCFGLFNDFAVVMLNQGELIIVIYNKMFFAQFFSFTTISNLLT